MVRVWVRVWVRVRVSVRVFTLHHCHKRLPSYISIVKIAEKRIRSNGSFIFDRNFTANILWQEETVDPHSMRLIILGMESHDDTIAGILPPMRAVGLKLAVVRILLPAYAMTASMI